VAWTGGARYLGQIFRWGTTIFVARLLSPDDYGLIGMTTLFSGVVALLAEFGVSSSVVRLRDLNEEQLGQLNGLSLVISVLAVLVSVAMAIPLSRFFGRQELVAIIPVSSLGFVLTSFQTVPSGVLQREMQFKTIAGIELTGAVLLASLVLLLAMTGAGYWALVLPSLVVGVVNAVRFRRLVPVRLRWPKLNKIREAYAYSLWIITGRVASYVLYTADFLMVGRLLGSAPLGNYTFAWDLANTPNDQINALVARVSGSFYANLQSDRRELTRLFLTLLEGVSALSVPLIIGLATVAPDFVLTVLGSKWAAAIPILQTLCLFTVLRVFSILLSPLLLMSGDARFQARVSILGLIYMPPMFYFAGTHWGAQGVAIAWLIGFPPLLLIQYFKATERLDIRIGSVLGALLPTLTGTLIMSLVVLYLASALPTGMTHLARLVTLVSVGAGSYVLVLVALFGSRVSGFARTIRGALRPA
jgi:PST family polysaccharide transporter